MLITVPLRDGTTCELPIGAYVQGCAGKHKKSRRYEIMGLDSEGRICVWEICLVKANGIYTRGSRQPSIDFVATGEWGIPKQASFLAPKLASNKWYPAFDPQSETERAYSLRLRDQDLLPLIGSGQEYEASNGQQRELLLEEEARYGLQRLRPEQKKFRKSVLDLYGARCALCGLDIRELIEAAHIKPKKDRGSDNPKNGLPLCGVHHRAFDAGLIAIAPKSLKIEYPQEDVDAIRLRITQADLQHLSTKPLPRAIEWRYQHPTSEPEEGAYPGP